MLSVIFGQHYSLVSFCYASDLGVILLHKFFSPVFSSTKCHSAECHLANVECHFWFALVFFGVILICNIEVGVILLILLSVILLHMCFSPVFSSTECYSFECHFAYFNCHLHEYYLVECHCDMYHRVRCHFAHSSKCHYLHMCYSSEYSSSECYSAE
jgi:hypothetical protein